MNDHLELFLTDDVQANFPKYKTVKGQSADEIFIVLSKKMPRINPDQKKDWLRLVIESLKFVKTIEEVDIAKFLENKILGNNIFINYENNLEEFYEFRTSDFISNIMDLYVQPMDDIEIFSIEPFQFFYLNHEGDFFELPQPN